MHKCVYKHQHADQKRSKFTNHSAVSTTTLVQRLKEHGKSRHKDLLCVAEKTRAVATANNRANQCMRKLEQSLTIRDYPDWLRNFITAVETGSLPHGGMQHVLQDMGESLLTGGQQQRNGTVKALYQAAARCGSPWVCKLFANTLMGPDFRTIRRWNADFFTILAGRAIENLHKLKEMLVAYNLQDVPGIWSEDATTCMKKLSATLDALPADEDGLDVYIEGFVEMIKIRSVADLNDAFAMYGHDGLASYVYV